VYLHNLHLTNSLTAHVEGGVVTFEGCQFTGSSTVDERALGSGLSQRRALNVHHGGIVHIARSRFFNLGGGAIAVTAGTVVIDESTFCDNRADKGGALLLFNGVVRLTGILFRKNRAQTSGGALYVDGGVVELARETRFIDNKAPQGASLCVAAARTRAPAAIAS
jgi:predicted outer membrane repeat protein